jgi:hypothetical protein
MLYCTVLTLYCTVLTLYCTVLTVQTVGTTGLSILFASGDVGEGGAWRAPCKSGEMQHGNEAGVVNRLYCT